MGLDNRPNDLPEKKTANKRNESDQSVAVKTCHHQRPVLERKGIRDTENVDWRLDPRRYSSWVHLVGVCEKSKRELAESCCRRKDEMPKRILFGKCNTRIFKKNTKL